MSKRDFKGVWIPREVWENEKLSWMEKLLFVEIDSLQDPQRGGCYASNGYFAHFFKLSRSRISEIISSLKKKGKVKVYLVHHPLDGRIETARLIKTEKLTIRKAEGSDRKTPPRYSRYRTAYSENGDYSITSNNTKSPGRAPSGAKDRPGPKKISAGNLKDPALRVLFEKDQERRQAEKGKPEEKK